MTSPLMPKATAVWLVDNTALTFEQIAVFCELHALEVKGIADGDVAIGIKGMDPISNGQLTRVELDRCVADPTASLQIEAFKHPEPQRRGKGPRYTPLSKRQERPDAILWLLRNHAELSDAQVSRLVGTTKPTINSIRERTHWNMPNIQPVDPVSLGLCSQIELDEAVQKAAKRKERADKRAAKEQGATLKPTETPAPVEEVPEEPVEEEEPLPAATALAEAAAAMKNAPRKVEAPIDVDAVFGTPAKDKEEKKETPSDS